MFPNSIVSAEFPVVISSVEKHKIMVLIKGKCLLIQWLLKLIQMIFVVFDVAYSFISLKKGRNLDCSETQFHLS